MDWGSMMGLGEGLQQLGGQVFKAKFLDKLKEEEDIRKEKRKEAKEANTVKEQRYVQKDGAWYEQDISLGTGRVMDERLAPQHKIKEFERQEQKDKIGLEASLLNLGKARREEGYAVEDRELDLSATRAKIRSEEAEARLKDAQSGYYATGGGAAASARVRAAHAEPRGGEPAQEASQEDYVQELIKQSSDLQRQYTQGRNPQMTPAEFRDMARDVVRASAARGIDPRAAFSSAIRTFLADPRTRNRKARGLEDMLVEDDEDSLD